MIFRASLIELFKAVKGRRQNMHARFIGIAFKGFGIGIFYCKKNEKSKEEYDSDMEKTIHTWLQKDLEEIRLKERRN